MTDILEPRPTVDRPVIISDPDTEGHDVEVVRTTPDLKKSDEENKYALAVRDDMIVRLVFAVETLVEQNEIIMMHLESMDS